MAMRRVARQKDGSLLIAARHALPHAPLGGPARLVERRHIVESADIALERLAGFLKAGFVGLAVVADQDAVLGAGYFGDAHEFVLADEIDRRSMVTGKSVSVRVDPGGGRNMKKK